MEKFLLILLSLIRDLVAVPLSVLLECDSLEKWIHKMRKKIHSRIARNKGCSHLFLVGHLGYDSGEDGPTFVYIKNEEEYSSCKGSLGGRQGRLLEEIKL